MSDRIISQGEIVKDQILTTLNGFIHDVTIVSSDRTSHGEIVIVIDVEVSEQAIANFVSIVEGSAASVDGESVFAEAERARKHSAVVSDVLMRIMDGYPRDAVEVTPSGVTVSADGNLLIDFELGPVSSFYTSLRQTLEALSMDSFPAGGGSRLIVDLAGMQSVACVQEDSRVEGASWKYEEFDCWKVVPAEVFDVVYPNVREEYLVVFSIVDEKRCASS
ncbi:MAG: hypothetical protein U5L08_07680 [Xanthomonadales bacterium]|nr:hypothetical protein [Xanthomonadales bacterium]